jgi:phage-related minor tail protein
MDGRLKAAHDGIRNTMSDPQTPINQSLDAAADALSAFVGGPVQSATASIETAVTRSFSSVENTIARAAISGKASMDDMITSILAGFDRIATTQFIVKPIESVLTSIAGAILPVGGARAAGGPVDAGTPYLVGEQGPELFTPGASGSIAPNSALGGAQVTLNVQTPDAQSFLKSQTQIAAMLSRAVAKGQRNL